MAILLVQTSSGLKGLGRTPIAAGGRDALVAGTYIPSSATVGPVWDGAFTQVYPSSPDATIDITSPGIYEGIEYWGRVRPRVAGIKFRHCKFRGGNPAFNPSALRGLIQNYSQPTGFVPPHFEVEDSLFDPSVWPTFWDYANRNGSALMLGVHGGNYTMKRCEIVNCQDGINYIGYAGGTYAQAMASHCLMEGNWIHKGFYINDWYGPSDGQPHADGFQINYGKNIEIVGNLIGGVRVPAGYAADPNRVPGALGWGNGTNLGDDFWNAAFMLKQETSNSENHKIENIVIRNNWIAGGTYSVNWEFVSARPNHWESMDFSDNWFLQRGSNWGNFDIDGSGGAGAYGNLTGWSGAYDGVASNNRIVPNFDQIYTTGSLAPGMNV